MSRSLSDPEAAGGGGAAAARGTSPATAALAYDFDMVQLSGEDPSLGDSAGEGPPGGWVALFRSADTAAALASAPAAVRELLVESGFGLAASGGGLPRRRYRQEHEAMRAEVLGRVAGTIETKGWPDEGGGVPAGVFDLHAFLAEALEARALIADDDVGPGPRRREKAPRRRRLGRILTLGLLAVAGYLLVFVVARIAGLA
jgi:hypothetical protein